MPAWMPAKHAWIMPGSIRGKAVMELKGTELSCVRGGRRVFTVVNFTVESSQSMVLTGANGAGKRSLPALDAASQERLGRVMRAHLGGGGIILAATHGPLGLDDAQELRLGPKAATP